MQKIQKIQKNPKIIIKTKQKKKIYIYLKKYIKNPKFPKWAKMVKNLNL